MILITKNDNKIVTPVNWRPGDRVIIPPKVSVEDANATFGADKIEQIELPSQRP